MDSDPLRGRNRIPKSCRRCHRRKKRCIGAPICTNCQSANQPCIRSETAPGWHHGMSKHAALKRIETLEAQLSTALNGAASAREDQLEATSTRNSRSPDVDGANPHNRQIADVVGFLTLGDGAGNEPAYVGSSSGFSIAKNLDQIVQDTVWAETLSFTASKQQLEQLSPMDARNNSVTPPDDAMGLRIVNAYFESMHVRYPFLDPADILELHAKRHQETNSSPQEQYGKFKIFMVYAIGVAILQLTETYNSTAPEDFFRTALKFNSMARGSHTIQSIEAMTLLVLYNLRSSSSSGIWYMTGLAMRTSIDLGLHREAHYRSLKPYPAQLRRRLFWSVYLMERNVAWFLGRPFSIAEQDIDAELPHDFDDSIHDDEFITQTLSSSTRSLDSQPPSNITRFIASLRLKRLESQIQTSIYRVDKSISHLLPEVAPLLSSLEEYERSLPSLTPVDDDFLRMHWNNTIRLLLQPFLSILKPEDVLIGTCIRASGNVCQLFKSLRQKSSLGYSFLVVQSVFMAGLTMCYCLFRSPTLWTTTVANDLRACSSALFVMAERSEGLKKYRDVLETVISNAMEFITQSSTSSHIISSTGRGHGVSSSQNHQATQDLYDLSPRRDFGSSPHSLLHPNQEPIDAVRPRMQAAESNYPQNGESAIIDPQLEPAQLFSSYQGFEADVQEFEGFEGQWNFFEYPQPLDGVSIEDMWDGDRFGLQMMNELLMPLGASSLRQDD